MAVTYAKKSGGGKLSRSETITVRLDPRLRYLAEIAARSERRTLSSYIEGAVQDSLAGVTLPVSTANTSSGVQETVISQATQLWDVDEADRFAKLALLYPSLLTYEEQVLWKLITEEAIFWHMHKDPISDEYTWEVNERSIDLPELREHWNTLVDVAAGKTERSELPKR